MVKFSLAFSAPPTHAARHTVDDAEANRSSIITVWKDPDPTKEDYQLVLTGDSIGYRVQQVLKPSTAGIGKNVTVFQVPHHGSARNSLPLEKKVLPPNDDITLVKQVFAFRFLLAYKFDRDKWDQIVSQEMGISHLNKSLRHVKFEVAMKLFVPVIVDTLNGMNLPYSSKKDQSQMLL